ncbi:DUF397 domain-containing protein [Lipingzhangella sp. LS1_29]|uniref:DUF397 domain-containing protein n=1 Tax=Lipingzhangella rawalii TaxID=2055835 RepID=A0ABU2H5A4_9ACTN|nr:DUF397 domain-containing protein [Lipingzhangella rawalii]MDS1270481.1 DUF397 domain-containing protein [Lipingzhangella rawalii]
MQQQWTTSSYSQDRGNCVECRTTSWDCVDIRDSQHPEQGHLPIPNVEWRALLGAIRRGEL